MSCRIPVLKAVLSVLNTVLAILGVGLIALSVYELKTSTPGTFERIAIVVQIFIGSFVILTSFLGCIGACRVSLGLTWSYAICLFILVAFQIYIIIAAHSTDYVQKATDNFNSLWKNSTFNAERIDEIEQSYQCCGKKGSEDYILLGRGPPVSCYRLRERSATNLFTNGCLETLQQHATDDGSNGLIIKWTLFLFELLSLGFAGLLIVTIRNKQRREQFGN